jgi:hypothetical protein
MEGCNEGLRGWIEVGSQISCCSPPSTKQGNLKRAISEHTLYPYSVCRVIIGLEVVGYSADSESALYPTTLNKNLQCRRQH